MKTIDATSSSLTEDDLNGSGMLSEFPVYASQINWYVRDVLRLILMERVSPRSGRLVRLLDELFTSRFCGSNHGIALDYIAKRVPERYRFTLNPYGREEYRESRLEAMQRRNEVRVPFCKPGCDLTKLVRGAGKHSKPKRFCPVCGRAHSPTGERDKDGRPKYKPLTGQAPLPSLRRRESETFGSIYTYA